MLPQACEPAQALRLSQRQFRLNPRSSSLQAVDGTALALGRPSGARVPLPAASVRSARSWHGCGGERSSPERLRCFRAAAALRKASDLEHPHGAVERHGHHVAGPHRAAGGVDALAVEADVTGSCQCCRGRARAHHARVPQPFVDALAVQSSSVIASVV